MLLHRACTNSWENIPEKIYHLPEPIEKRNILHLVYLLISKDCWYTFVVGKWIKWICWYNGYKGPKHFGFGINVQGIQLHWIKRNICFQKRTLKQRTRTGVVYLTQYQYTNLQKDPVPTVKNPHKNPTYLHGESNSFLYRSWLSIGKFNRRQLIFFLSLLLVLSN